MANRISMQEAEKLRTMAIEAARRNFVSTNQVVGQIPLPRVVQTTSGSVMTTGSSPPQQQNVSQQIQSQLPNSTTPSRVRLSLLTELLVDTYIASQRNARNASETDVLREEIADVIGQCQTEWMKLKTQMETQKLKLEEVRLDSQMQFLNEVFEDLPQSKNVYWKEWEIFAVEIKTRLQYSVPSFLASRTTQEMKLSKFQEKLRQCSVDDVLNATSRFNAELRDTKSVGSALRVLQQIDDWGTKLESCHVVPVSSSTTQQTLDVIDLFAPTNDDDVGQLKTSRSTEKARILCVQYWKCILESHAETVRHISESREFWKIREAQLQLAECRLCALLVLLNNDSERIVVSVPEHLKPDIEIGQKEVNEQLLVTGREIDTLRSSLSEQIPRENIMYQMTVHWFQTISRMICGQLYRLVTFAKNNSSQTLVDFHRKDIEQRCELIGKYTEYEMTFESMNTGERASVQYIKDLTRAAAMVAKMDNVQLTSDKTWQGILQTIEETRNSPLVAYKKQRDMDLHEQQERIQLLQQAGNQLLESLTSSCENATDDRIFQKCIANALPAMNVVQDSVLLKIADRSGVTNSHLLETTEQNLQHELKSNHVSFGKILLSEQAQTQKTSDGKQTAWLALVDVTKIHREAFANDLVLAQTIQNDVLKAQTAILTALADYTAHAFQLDVRSANQQPFIELTKTMEESIHQVEKIPVTDLQVYELTLQSNILLHARMLRDVIKHAQSLDQSPITSTTSSTSSSSSFPQPSAPPLELLHKNDPTKRRRHDKSTSTNLTSKTQETDTGVGTDKEVYDWSSLKQVETTIGPDLSSSEEQGAQDSQSIISESKTTTNNSRDDLELSEAAVLLPMEDEKRQKAKENVAISKQTTNVDVKSTEDFGYHELNKQLKQLPVIDPLLYKSSSSSLSNLPPVTIRTMTVDKSSETERHAPHTDLTTTVEHTRFPQPSAPALAAISSLKSEPEPHFSKTKPPFMSESEQKKKEDEKEAESQRMLQASFQLQQALKLEAEQLRSREEEIARKQLETQNFNKAKEEEDMRLRAEDLQKRIDAENARLRKENDAQQVKLLLQKETLRLQTEEQIRSQLQKSQHMDADAKTRGETEKARIQAESLRLQKQREELLQKQAAQLAVVVEPDEDKNTTPILNTARRPQFVGVRKPTNKLGFQNVSVKTDKTEAILTKNDDVKSDDTTKIVRVEEEKVHKKKETVEEEEEETVEEEEVEAFEEENEALDEEERRKEQEARAERERQEMTLDKVVAKQRLNKMPWAPCAQLLREEGGASAAKLCLLGKCQSIDTCRTGQKKLLAHQLTDKHRVRVEQLFDALNENEKKLQSLRTVALADLELQVADLFFAEREEIENEIEELAIYEDTLRTTLSKIPQDLPTFGDDHTTCNLKSFAMNTEHTFAQQRSFINKCKQTCQSTDTKCLKDLQDQFKKMGLQVSKEFDKKLQLLLDDKFSPALQNLYHCQQAVAQNIQAQKSVDDDLESLEILQTQYANLYANFTEAIQKVQSEMQSYDAQYLDALATLIPNLASELSKCDDWFWNSKFTFDPTKYTQCKEIESKNSDDAAAKVKEFLKKDVWTQNELKHDVHLSNEEFKEISDYQQNLLSINSLPDMKKIKDSAMGAKSTVNQRIERAQQMITSEPSIINNDFIQETKTDIAKMRAGEILELQKELLKLQVQYAYYNGSFASTHPKIPPVVSFNQSCNLIEDVKLKETCINLQNVCNTSVEKEKLEVACGALTFLSYTMATNQAKGEDVVYINRQTEERAVQKIETDFIESRKQLLERQQKIGNLRKKILAITDAQDPEGLERKSNTALLREQLVEYVSLWSTMNTARSKFTTKSFRDIQTFKQALDLVTQEQPVIWSLIEQKLLTMAKQVITSVAAEGSPDYAVIICARKLCAGVEALEEEFEKLKGYFREITQMFDQNEASTPVIRTSFQNCYLSMTKVSKLISELRNGTFVEFEQLSKPFYSAAHINSGVGQLSSAPKSCDVMKRAIPENEQLSESLVKLCKSTRVYVDTEENCKSIIAQYFDPITHARLLLSSTLTESDIQIYQTMISVFEKLSSDCAKTKMFFTSNQPNQQIEVLARDLTYFKEHSEHIKTLYHRIDTLQNLMKQQQQPSFLFQDSLTKLMIVYIDVTMCSLHIYQKYAMTNVKIFRTKALLAFSSEEDPSLWSFLGDDDIVQQLERFQVQFGNGFCDKSNEGIFQLSTKQTYIAKFLKKFESMMSNAYFKLRNQIITKHFVLLNSSHKETVSNISVIGEWIKFSPIIATTFELFKSRFNVAIIEQTKLLEQIEAKKLVAFTKLQEILTEEGLSDPSKETETTCKFLAELLKKNQPTDTTVIQGSGKAGKVAKK